QRLLVQRDKEVDPVDVGSEFPRVNPQPIIAVLSFDVGMILDICEDMKPASDAGLGEVLGDRVDAAALRAADHPSQAVRHTQRLFVLQEAGSIEKFLLRADNQGYDSLILHYKDGRHRWVKKGHY